MAKEYKSFIPKISLFREKTEIKKVKITSSQIANDYAHQFYDYDINIHESVFLILTNSQRNTIGYAKISQGGIGASIVDVRLIAKLAISALSTCVILVHNHPSGSLKPSRADIEMTKKVKNALNLLDIELTDHIIITEDKDKYYSFQDENML